MEFTELEILADELSDYFVENRLFVSAYPVVDYIEVEIHWGDWKHEHLRCDWLTRDFFEKNGKTAVIETEVTEEDGSDCYSAIHRIYVR